MNTYPSRFTPHQALEMQDELGRWLQTDYAIRFFDGWTEARKRDGYPTAQDSPLERVKLEQRRILGARTYWISEEMVELASHAARSMPHQPIGPEDLPCPNGFMLFEQPVVMPDAHGKSITLAAICWEVVTALTHEWAGHVHSPVSKMPGVLWTYWSDLEDPRDSYGQEMPAATQRWLCKAGFRICLSGEDFEGFGRGECAVDFLAKHFSVSADSIQESLHWQRRMPIALWVLMEQTLAVNTDERPARPLRRRMEKENSPLAASLVRVVTLRRARHELPEGHEPSKVNWSHRWIVGGHWRNQWLASRQMHRLQWIAPYVKGPDEKPLAIKRTVHTLVR